MYPNLKKTLFSKNISMKSYAEFLGVTEKTVQNKMNGISDFSLPEAEKTKRILLPEYDMMYLFSEEAQTEHRQVGWEGGERAGIRRTAYRTEAKNKASGIGAKTGKKSGDP